MTRYTVRNVLRIICFLQFPSFLLTFQLRFPPRHISLAQFASMLNEDEQNPLSSFTRPSSFEGQTSSHSSVGKRAFDRLDASSLGLMGYWGGDEPLTRLEFQQAAEQAAPDHLDDEEEAEKPPPVAAGAKKKNRRWARELLGGKKRRVNGFGLFGGMRLK